MTSPVLHRVVIGVLLVATAVVFAVPWTLAAQSLRDAIGHGWPGPSSLPVAALNADESMLGLRIAVGTAILLLALGLFVVGFAARTSGYRVAPVVTLGGAGVVVVASVAAFALTTPT